MADKTRRTILVTLGGTVTAGLAGCAGGGGGDDDNETDDGGMGGGGADDNETDGGDGTETETANVRVAHFSPDAPNVDVYVDGERSLSDVPFRAVSDYMEVPAGTRAIKITAAGDESTVAAKEEVTVEANTDYTIAAIGELEGEKTEFRPLVLEDDTSEPGEGMARVRVVHVSPDAPAVDVTTSGGEKALVDGVEFGESQSAEVEPGEYTLEIRGDMESNDGDVVSQSEVTLEENMVYTVFAGGYLAREDVSEDTAFELTVVTGTSS